MVICVRDIYQLYASLTDVQSHAQKKGERFKDLFIRNLVIAGRLKWRAKFHNVETSHFQEEWVARGLELEHNQEEGMVPIMDTCLGYSAVLGAELFSEQEQMEEEVRTSCLVIWTQTDILLQSTTLRRNIANLEKRYLELEKKYIFSMEMHELMMRRVTNTEISVVLLRSRFESHPPQRFDLLVGEEDAEGEVDVLEAPIALGSHIVGLPKPEGSLLERIEPSPELTWEAVQESINSMATTWVDSLVGEHLDIAPK